MTFDTFWANVVGFVWGLPLVVTLGLASVYFTVISGVLPLRKGKHAFAVLLGRYDSKSDPGELTHFQALSTALSGTIGMGNIAGVAVAITMGGSGAVLLVCVAGALGMATKFLSFTLSIMYCNPLAACHLHGCHSYCTDNGLRKPC